MGQSDGAGYGQSSSAGVTYPRVYRYKVVARFFLYLFAAILGGVGTWMAAVPILHPSPAGSWLLLTGAVLALLGIYIATSAASARLTLRADAIELRGLWRSRELRLGQLAGRRRQATRGGSILLLIPKTGRRMRLDSGFPRDSALNAWIDALPDLDLQERLASEAALLADPSFGSNPKERQARLAQARQITQLVSGATIAAMLWAYLYPYPYTWAIVLLALLPWCAVIMVMLSHGLICFDAKRNDARPNMLVALMLPAILLGLRALLDDHLMEVVPALVYGLIAGVPLLLAACLAGKRDPSRPWALPMLLLPLVALPYGGGLVVHADVMLDHQPAQVFQARVMRKYISTGRHPTPHLVLAPWGPKVMGDDMTVNRAYYAHVDVAAKVCVNLHRGAVGLRWYEVQDCAAGTTGASAQAP
ncbi:hypothetical protein [Rhodanobacter terrae]|uniref:PH domain-containing protein n=1 Tax=Rhodanobacter terrae TaxID=418647 RepID=A0ABW0SXI8_9GAMM